MVASWINPRSSDVAVTMGGSHFLLSAIEYVVACSGRYFLHMADDSFCEVSSFTFDTWKGRHPVEDLETDYYTCADLSEEWPESPGDNGSQNGSAAMKDGNGGAVSNSSVVWIRLSCVIAVAKRQRRSRFVRSSPRPAGAYNYEVFTAAGFTIPVKTSGYNLDDALIPAEAAIGKFLVWDYAPCNRRYRDDVWMVTIRCGTVETAKVMDRLDMAFVDVYFTNGVHCLLDVIVDPSRVPDIEASFLTATPQPQISKASTPAPSSFHSLFM